jgi:DNA-binding LacI/PurR family transcriptional regulator
MPLGRVTMEDVARRAGVSRALVSIVFRGVAGASAATRERVLASARELDYHPDTRASRLGRSRTRTLGVVFSVGHAFHGDLLESLYVEAESAGYELVLSGVTTQRSEDHAVETLLAERCEALLLLGSGLPAARLAQVATRVPVVSVLRPVKAAGVDVVRTDDAAGMRQVVEHLVGLGHQRVALLDGGREAGAAQRRQGFRSAHRMRLPRAAEVLVRGGLTEEGGAAAARMFLALDPPRPTAVVAFNDRCALGFIDVLRQEGLRVPEGVSVVGFDDIRQAAYEHVGLTTVHQDARQLGARALERVTAHLDDGDADAREVVVRPQLVVRRSTSRPERT